MLVSRDRNAPAAAHCVKKLFRSATDTVGLSVPQAQGMRSTAKEVSAITLAPREVCRTGNCAQPSIYQLATAVDPATAAGGAAAAARPPAPTARAPLAPQLRQEKLVKFIALDKAFPSDYGQAAAAGKPAPALGPGPAGNKRHRHGVRLGYRETQ
jgi:hypothetical protein